MKEAQTVHEALVRLRERTKKEDQEAEVTVDAMTNLCGNQKNPRTVVAVPADLVGPAHDPDLLVLL